MLHSCSKIHFEIYICMNVTFTKGILTWLKNTIYYTFSNSVILETYLYIFNKLKYVNFVNIMSLACRRYHFL